MAGIDSSADLLFTVAADPSDATANMQRFRALMSKDLAAMGAEWKDWAAKVFGNLTTFQGAMTAGVAGGVAGLVALTAGAVKLGEELWNLGEKAAHYAEKIEDGVDKTGLSAETMSGLAYAAKNAGLDYEGLVASLVKFETTIVKAQDADSDAAKRMHQLGFSQKEIQAATTDLLPFLHKYSDAMREAADGTLKTARLREDFGKSGAEMIEFLNQGSEGWKRFAAEAEHAGLVLTEKDLVAAKAFKLEMIALNAEMEGLKIQIGTGVLPLMGQLTVALEAYLRAAPKILEVYKNQEWWKGILPGGREIATVREGLKIWEQELEAARERLAGRMQAAMAQGTKALPVPETAKATQDFWGLTNVLEQLRAKSAEAQGEEAKLAQEMAHLQLEVNKATAEFIKLRDAGKLDPEALKREMAALMALPGALGKAAAEQTREMLEKQGAAVRAAGADLQQQITAQQEETAAQQGALWDDQMTKLAVRLWNERKLTEENQDLLAELWQAGYRRMARDRNEAFKSQLEALQRDLAAMVTAHHTAFERIGWQYQQDLVRFSQAEEQKKLTEATSDAEREALRRQFDLNRAVAFARYGEELTALYNSQGWRGIFGSEFGALIRGNEELLREWTFSAQQSLLMVRVAAESMKEMLQQTFGEFAKGMGQNIANAIVYQKSIGTALRAAAAAALESLAARAISEAIFAMAYGWMLFAERDYGGATAAWIASGIFASLGVTAAIAGRAIAPKEAAAAGKAGQASASAAAAAAPAAGAGGTQESGPRVVIYVQGHIVGQSGVEELTQMINEAVQGRDVRLTATAVKQLGAAVK